MSDSKIEGAPAHGFVAHLLPNTYKRLVSEWLEEDTPSFDYGGFVVGEEISEAKLLGKSEHCATVRGPVRNLLLGERVALNTLARCSGIATKSNRVLALLRKAGYPNILAGTRKTTPGFRLVEKYGMLVGGVDAHRVDLSAMTMLKDNHIVAAGSITNAVRAAKSAGGFAIKVEVECQSFEEADEAIAAGADIVMLDNFTSDGVKAAAAQLKDKWGRGTGDRKQFLVEVSGGLTEENVEPYVCADVDIISTDRLLDLFYENFWHAFPFVLPHHYLNARKLNLSHGMENLLLVLQWIGSVYAPWTPAEPYYEAARLALSSPTLPRDPWSVQALALLAIGEHHWDLRLESKDTLNKAVSVALEVQMNTREFARAYGEGSAVLEESWRRTYYYLALVDQHFAVVVNTPMFPLRDVPNLVDLPCEDEFFLTGQIPPPATWQEYDTREFADVEAIYSSIVYMIDVSKIVTFIMRSFTETGAFSDSLIAAVDAKVAAWQSLLPACKKDPMRQNGTIDEIMFQAHLMAAIVIMTSHRPFSSLTYSIEELSTESFASPVPFIEPLKQNRGTHTARILKAIDIQTKLLAIPCAIERHNVFTACMVATLSTAQISACNILLEDHALSIARDRVRLSIGCLNAMGTIWPLAKKMAREVRYVARRTLAGLPSLTMQEAEPEREIEVPRDEIIWPVDPSAQIDIFAGISIPVDWDAALMGYSSSTTSSLS
ncbi:nicotinate-nucleotide diphosphorylase [Lentithecium fluviatile CBS 122367]|uniref:Nicotinate-nucleotide pyrophosphorylase [carboxylating] n=1 Tax=Lentithecium fluviatile CBS 122367 TaxID=1168545 RepID=A0A6G1IM72_9PLEO|nr:nicotinate-nucleotide diphosphorylase [Lentithecium fluviatile CBS 122367]